MGSDAPRSIDEIRRRKRAEEMDDKLHEEMTREAAERANTLKQSCMGYCGFHPLKPLDFGKAMGRLADWVCHTIAMCDVTARRQHAMIANLQVEVILLRRALRSAKIPIETRADVMESRAPECKEPAGEPTEDQQRSPS